MSNDLTSVVSDWIVQVISTTGYLGISSLMALESACIPLPSEIIMPFAGYLVSKGHFTLFWVATAGAIGCNVGSTAAYLVAAFGGRKAAEKWGAFVLVGPHELKRAERYFAKYGSATVFFGRLVPVIRTFIAVPAGLARMPQTKFQLYTFLGSWPWCFGLALVGEQLGEHWNKDSWLQSVFHQADLLIAAGLVLLVIWWLWRRRIAARGND
jgi:membrane protein DedA with SNARE-associated domain